MPDTVFLDTVGLLALLNEDDSLHQIAVKAFAEIEREGLRITTTDLVLAEFANGLARTPLRQEVGWLIRELEAEPRATIVYVDRTLFERGLALYVARDDKAWGLVDCISFEPMRGLGISDAFAADRHFEQAGFHCLLAQMRGR